MFQWVFYIFSAFALLWLPLWLPVQASNIYKAKPGSDGAIAELADPIASSSAGTAIQLSQQQQLEQGDRKADPLGATGFWALMKRREVWAICVAQVCPGRRGVCYS